MEKKRKGKVDGKERERKGNGKEKERERKYAVYLIFGQMHFFHS